MNTNIARSQHLCQTPAPFGGETQVERWGVADKFFNTTRPTVLRRLRSTVVSFRYRCIDGFDQRSTASRTGRRTTWNGTHAIRTRPFRRAMPSPKSNSLRRILSSVLVGVSTDRQTTPNYDTAPPLSVAADLVPVLRGSAERAHHAHARNVRVAVSGADDVILTVTDDGVGVPEEVLGGRGLANLTERARSLGGDFDIVPQVSGGSLLPWRVPVRKPSRAPTS